MLPADALGKCWFLTGPTAGGKTAAALALSRQINAEIVSMDSMAVYRDMDIGTAKPTPDEQADVRHHLIDIVEPHQEFSVSEYIEHAALAVDDILTRGKVPLFVGGTGLYLRSLLRGVFEGPEADWAIRAELEQLAEDSGNEVLHQKLAKVDPVTAQKLHPNDRRRIIRAIEVFRLTGKALSTFQNHNPLPLSDRPAAVYWIDPPRDWLHKRINRRVDLMMEQGLLDETKRLLQRKPTVGRTARQGLGYRELISHLENDVPLSSAVEEIKAGTRQFAKRQHTWFRHLEEVSSVPITGLESSQQLAQQLIDRTQRSVVI